MTFDEIAVAAMVALIANPERDHDPEPIARLAFKYAESMMAAIEKRDAEIFEADLAEKRAEYTTELTAEQMNQPAVTVDPVRMRSQAEMKALGLK